MTDVIQPTQQKSKLRPVVGASAYMARYRKRTALKPSLWFIAYYSSSMGVSFSRSFSELSVISFMISIEGFMP